MTALPSDVAEGPQPDSCTAAASQIVRSCEGWGGCGCNLAPATKAKPPPLRERAMQPLQRTDAEGAEPEVAEAEQGRVDGNADEHARARADRLRQAQPVAVEQQAHEDRLSDIDRERHAARGAEHGRDAIRGPTGQDQGRGGEVAEG